MAAPKAPLLDGGGNASKQVTLESEIFGAELKPHLVHETVRGVLADDAISEPSTNTAAALLHAWGKELPAVVVAAPEQEAVVKSFRNLDRVAVSSPAELEVAAVVWARSLLVTESALPLVQGRA